MGIELVIGILLIIAAIFLIIAVLLQSNKDKSLSGAIAGGSAETFYSKNKGKGIDGWLPKVTTVVAILFVVLVLISFLIQDDADLKGIYDELTGTESVESTSDETSTEGTGTEADSSDDASDEGTVTSGDETDESNSETVSDSDPAESSSAA